MRIPKVGEKGWQVRSLKGRFEAWRDCEILGFLDKDDFYHSSPHSKLGGPFVELLVQGIATSKKGSIHALRRKPKPEQKDSTPAEEGFQKDLTQWLGNTRREHEPSS